MVWYFLLMMMAGLAAATGLLIYQYASKGALDAGPILGVLCGWVVGLLIHTWVRRKNSGTAWAVYLLSFFLVPVVLFFLLMGLNKVLGLHLSLTLLVTIYIAALAAIFLLARRLLGKIMSGPPPWAEKDPDERDITHLAWSGLVGFSVLSILLVAALLQPWLSYSDPRLWLGVLGLGMLSWFVSLLGFSVIK